MNKKIGIIIAGSVFVGGYLIYGHFNQVVAKNKEINKTEVKNVKIESREKEEITNGFIKKRGVIKGQREVYLSSKAEGRVQKIYKEIGERVYRGQLLAVVDGREVWAQSQVAQTGFNFADSTVSKTKKFFESQIKQAKKARDLAKEGYKNAKRSGDQEKIGGAKSNYEMAKKAVDTAKRGYDLQVKMARGQRDVAQSQLNAANIMAGNTRLTAPFSGVIAQVQVEVGDLVSPQRPMFLLVDDSQKEVEVSLEGRLLKKLKAGDTITVIAGNGESKDAKIKAVSPMIDTHTRKGILKIVLPKDNVFAIGEYLEVLIPYDANVSEKLSIPQEALVKIYHDNFVFVVDGDVARQRRVELGDIIGNRIIIKKGLSREDKIIIEGQQYLSDGDMIKVLK